MGRELGAKRNYQQSAARERDQRSEISEAMRGAPSSEAAHLSRIKGELAALSARIATVEELITDPKPSAPPPQRPDLTARVIGVIALAISACCLALILAARMGALPK